MVKLSLFCIRNILLNYDKNSILLWFDPLDWQSVSGPKHWLRVGVFKAIMDDLRLGPRAQPGAVGTWRFKVQVSQKWHEKYYRPKLTIAEILTTLCFMTACVRLGLACWAKALLYILQFIVVPRYFKNISIFYIFLNKTSWQLKNK